ncbi:hypothetical protein PT974_02360 [Cladobotryum mycophilum]|uniref:Uncharacterized protein n=1 Tax=Cladobotryum mycophilum TaxID=491253 RepID=A0ABR0SZ65_9HYPO
MFQKIFGIGIGDIISSYRDKQETRTPLIDTTSPSIITSVAEQSPLYNHHFYHYLDISKQSNHNDQHSSRRLDRPISLQQEKITRRILAPPEYSSGEYVELRALSTTSSTSSVAPPNYELAVAGSSSSSSSSSFQATTSFQIDTLGHPLIALPFPQRPIPIPVYVVDHTGCVGNLAYQSVRPERSSGNSALFRAGDEHPVCSTTYRFGPGRPPKIQLSGVVAYDEEFEVNNRGITTRAQVIRTHLGTFQWRYASKQERREAVADSLLILDRITSVTLEGGKQEEQRKPVAQLVRNAEFRTEGSKSSTAGNGGRLVMDLREWLGTKGEAEQMEVLAVASCLAMLKKEIDRRRMHQAIVIMGAASGGGP